MPYVSTKTYTPGWSCAFRQWRATHSHCSLIHGYALGFHLEFHSATLDDKNWVMDFGALKEVKKWLEDTFDHKLVLAADDPALAAIRGLPEGVVDLSVLPAVGCEAFAEYVWRHVDQWLRKNGAYPRVKIAMVECREHGTNSAQFRAPKEYLDGSA